MTDEPAGTRTDPNREPEPGVGEPDAQLPPAPPTSQPTGPLAPSEAERAAAARARGLQAPYVAGGRDPDPDAGRREERFYGRLLLAMVVAIVAGGFVLGVIANVIVALRGS